MSFSRQNFGRRLAQTRGAKDQARVSQAQEALLSLIPQQDVAGEAGFYIASRPAPWLSIEPFATIKPGRWFRMRYRISLFDDPARPLVSFRRGGAEIGWHILPGPVFGRAEWVGIAPEGADAFWISPVSAPGPFCFAIEEIKTLSDLEILRLGLSGDRRRLVGAVGTLLLGWREEARDNFRWATQSATMALWPNYRDRLAAALPRADFERPREDWAKAPAIRLAMRRDDALSPEQVDATLVSLRSQIYPRWTLAIVGGEDKCGAPLDFWRAKEQRIAAQADLDWLEREGEDDDLLGFIAAGDRLAPHALACFIEASLKTPQARVFYCDEEIETPAGERPVFKPDWSPRLQQARPYVGRLMLTRRAHFRERVNAAKAAADEVRFVETLLRDLVLRDLGREDVVHIRRVLVQTRRCDAPEREMLAPSRTHAAPRDTSVAIIVPTRNRAEFLRRTVAGVLRKTKFASLRLIIVDNGSGDEEALEVLARAAEDSRVATLQSPGPFNFSALCNLGAAEAQSDVLVFLNNDMEIIDENWLGALIEEALDPGVGAIGCKLLYPDGRIQHAGLALGLGDGVGHFESGAPDGEPGWLGRNKVLRETSAVTGACLAVERAKFLAVGGFDATHLPIEFNDVDLCLRLEERGWRTLWTPFARLIHFESSSRGRATFRRLEIHAAERAYFRRRWGHRLRDDPFLHPGLSLFSLAPALA